MIPQRVLATGQQAAKSSSLLPALSATANQVRFFGIKKPLRNNKLRIEEKLGVGIRYRQPRTWDGKTDKIERAYEAEEVKKWREEYGMPRMMHSLSKVSYSDEEIIQWRLQFDKFAGNNGMISFKEFEGLVRSKYTDLEAKQIPTKVIKVWEQFDVDGNNFIDFGEFCKCSFKFDFLRLKDSLKDEGVSSILEKYKDEDGYITEDGIFNLMKDTNFTLSTTSDMRKILKQMDQDKDGMVGEGDLKKFLDSPDDQFL